MAGCVGQGGFNTEDRKGSSRRGADSHVMNVGANIVFCVCETHRMNFTVCELHSVNKTQQMAPNVGEVEPHASLFKM